MSFVVNGAHGYRYTRRFRFKKLSDILREVELMYLFPARYPSASEYICHNLNAIATKYPLHYGSCNYLRMWVEDMIAPCKSFETWLFSNHRELYNSWLIEGSTKSNLKRCRIGWLNWMIEELEKTGE